MINPVNLVLIVQLAQLLSEFLRRIRIPPKRLFDNQTYPVFGVGAADTVAIPLQATTNHRVDCRRQRQVVEATKAATAALLLRCCHGQFQSPETIITVVRPRHVGAARQKGIHCRLVGILALEQKGRQPLTELPVLEIGSRVANDAQAVRQKPVLVQKVQRRVRLLLRQVARRTSNDNGQVQAVLTAIRMPVLTLDMLLPYLERAARV